MFPVRGKFILRVFFLCILVLGFCVDEANGAGASEAELRVAQVVSAGANALSRNYASALPSLLKSARETTGLPFVSEPILVSSFTDPRLSECPFLYINWDDRKDWQSLGDAEMNAFRNYLQNGGLAMIDAGIAASFLRSSPGQSQHHSFAEWEPRPDVRDFFAKLFPAETFVPLRRDDPLYRNCFEGLPDASLLPEVVRDYAQEEKWPSGTYAAVALRLEGRLAVLCTPVIALGWGRDVRGWTTTIRFRALEGTAGLGELLEGADYSGPRFEVTREDGGKDAIYCQGNALPAWSQDPAGIWRVFRYYDSRQISDFTHVFYTRLGINILVTALLGD